MWIGQAIPPMYAEFIEGWKRLHPRWEHRLWTEDNLPTLRNQALWDRAPDIAPRAVEQFRSDVARYEILEQFGGVWVDADFEPRKPIDPLMDEPWAVAEGRWVANGIIAITPGHSLMDRAIRALPHSVKIKRGQPNTRISGPQFFTRLAIEAELKVLPEQWFLPYSYRELHRAGEDFPDAYAVHHWHNQRRLKGTPLGWDEPVSGDLGGSYEPPVTLSIAVMAHPKRQAFVTDLLPRLDRPAEVVWDQENNRWDTGKRAMLAYDPACSHHLVIQDDAIPCRDLAAGVERALLYVPKGSPVSLYVGRVRPYGSLVTQLVEEAKPDASWIVMDKINWGPGIVVPTAEIPAMIDFVTSIYADPNYDRRISRWFEHRKRRCYYTWPSLVEHRDSPSLVPRRGAQRHAHTFLGEEVSALTVDWTGRVAAVPQRDRDRVQHNERSTRRTRGEVGPPGRNWKG